MKTNTVAQPAAGADWTWTVPSSTAYQIQSIRAQLVTSSTVAARQPLLKILDLSGNVVLEAPATGTQAASLTQDYDWTAGAPSAAVSDGVVVTELPQGLILEAGWTVQTVTAALQAGDQWSLIVVTDTGVTQTF